MTIRWTEEEYERHQARVRSQNTRKVPPSKPAEEAVGKRKKRPQRKNERAFFIECISGRKRSFDTDNQVPKPWIDCLVDLGVIPEDDVKNVKGIWKTGYISPGEECVYLKVYELIKEK